MQCNGGCHGGLRLSDQYLRPISHLATAHGGFFLLGFWCGWLIWQMQTTARVNDDALHEKRLEAATLTAKIRDMEVGALHPVAHLAPGWVGPAS